jgi:dynein heavy chain
MGLPHDSMSTENALLITSLKRKWPLIIDPQDRATKWIKKMEGQRLAVLSMSDSTFLRSLENAVRTGQPVLIEKIDEKIDPLLTPLLLRQSYKKGGRLLMKLGESEIDYSKDFRLYITSKLSNPQFAADIFAKCAIVNFTVTPEALEEQLLSDVVRIERNDLEHQKDELILRIAQDKRQLKEVEEKILLALATKKGQSNTILDDEVVTNILSESKVTSDAIGIRLAETEIMARNIDSVRDVYRQVAERGVILYFVIDQLSQIDTMYQYSLDFFAKLFTQCIEKTPPTKTEILALRIHTLMTSITEYIFTHISKGLYDKDKIVLAFSIAAEILKAKNKIATDEWNFFLRGVLLTEKVSKDSSTASPQANPCSAWLSDSVWASIIELDKISSFRGLSASFSMESAAWKTFYQDLSYMTNTIPPLPDIWNAQLGDFQKLILLKVLREEKVFLAAKSMITNQLDASYLQTSHFDLNKTLQDSSPATPIILLLSTGYDPTPNLIELAKTTGNADKLKVISLGQGQGAIASQVVQDAAKLGFWVCLQNCHLAVSWLPELEKLLDSFDHKSTKLHSEFRLWLTTNPTSSFPVSILQRGLKITNEAPKGLKENLSRTYLDMAAEKFEGSPHKGWRKLLFGLCLFHAVIVERQKFGPLTWNVVYDWNTADLNISVSLLKRYLDEQIQKTGVKKTFDWKKKDDQKMQYVPFKALHYLIGDIVYGGRVTDSNDLRTLKNLLRRYISEDVLNEKFFYTELGSYSFSPEDANLMWFRSHIQSLPLQDTPTLFGLHPNADLSLQRNDTKYLLDIVTSLQPRIVQKDAISVEASTMAILDRIQSSLPSAIDISKAHTSHLSKEKDSPATPLWNFVVHEVRQYNKLIATVETSLFKLQEALRGRAVLSTELENMLSDISFKRVPLMWKAVSYPSLKVLDQWLSDLNLRVRFFKNWVEQGDPSAFWISSFFFPQGFLTALLQTYARQNEVPVDSVTFKCKIHDFFYDEVQTLLEPPKHGTYIYGLSLEGATWDKSLQAITESKQGNLYSKMPVIHLSPTHIYDNQESNTNFFDCPLYKTITRSRYNNPSNQANFVTYLQLPTTQEPSHWICRGYVYL